MLRNVATALASAIAALALAPERVRLKVRVGVASGLGATATVTVFDFSPALKVTTVGARAVKSEPAVAVPLAVLTFTVTCSPATGATLSPTVKVAVVAADVERNTLTSRTDTENAPWRLISVAVATESAIEAAVAADSTRSN